MNAPWATSILTNKSYQRPVSDLIQQAREGVLRRRVDEVAGLVGLTDEYVGSGTTWETD